MNLDTNQSVFVYIQIETAIHQSVPKDMLSDLDTEYSCFVDLPCDVEINTSCFAYDIKVYYIVFVSFCALPDFRKKRTRVS